MNPNATAQLACEAFAQFAEVGAPLVESELAESNHGVSIVLRSDGTAGFAP